MLVLQDQPVARNDQFEVEQDSVGNSLDVLANDFPSSTGVLSIVGVTQPGRGQVTISPDGKTVLFTPNAGIFSPPEEKFTYTISDGTGKTDSATVLVSVQPTMIKPLAVDDTYRVNVGSIDNVMRVLDNDLPGILGTMRLLTVTAPSSGSAVINNNGTPSDPSDDFIIYSPNSTFAAVDQFQYTIGNANGTSAATVTVFEEPAPADQGLDISIDITDSNGTPISEVPVDSEFVVVISVQDMRGGLVDKGVAAAYLDVLFSRDLVSPKSDPGSPFGFEIIFSPEYANAKSGDAKTPGLLNEVGGFQTSGSPLGNGRLTLFEVTFRANAPGTATFTGDPADVSPDHDVLFFQPPAVAALADIHYGFTSLTVFDGGGSGEPNGNNLDVNDDGKVSPLDALMVINALNSPQAPRGSNLLDFRLDVNRDNVLAPIDALLVVNFLNFHGGGEGESPAVAAPVAGSAQMVYPDLQIGRTVTVAMQGDDFDTFAGAAGSVPVARTNVTAPITDLSLSEPLSESWPASCRPAEPVDAFHAADRTGDPLWESLLSELAPDVLEAWLDGGEA